MKKETAFTIIFYLLVFFILTAVAEAGFRLYHASKDRSRYIYIPDYYLGYRLAKNNTFLAKASRQHPEYRTKQFTNARSIVDKKEILVPKPEDVYRIVVIGDSFTESFQVEIKEKFTSLLEEKLNMLVAYPGRKFEVINAGVRGYSPIVHYLNYKRNLARLDADLVIVQLFANDVAEDNHVAAKSLMGEDGLPVKLNRYFLKKYYQAKAQDTSGFIAPAWQVSWHERLMDASRLYEYVWVHVMKLRKKSAFNTRMRKDPRYNDAYQFFIIQNHDAKTLFQDEHFLSLAWQRSAGYLLSLKELVEGDGARFMIMHIPIEAALTLKKYGEHQHLFFAQPPTEYLVKRLEEMSIRYDINYFDLTPAFERTPKKEKLYFHWDGHLTPTGHQVLKEALFDYLTRNRLHKNPAGRR